MSTVWKVDGHSQLVDPADRGLAYGDGLFETMAAVDGAVPWLEFHLNRLFHGLQQLRIPAPDRHTLLAEIQTAAPPRGRAVLKLIVTRGASARGYRPSPNSLPTRILGVAPWPEYPASHYTAGIDVEVCTLRLGDTPALAGLKHLCRLEQVLAQMELANMDAEEGLLLDGRGAVIGGTSSNIFTVRAGRLRTPAVNRCGVRGVMRTIVLESASQLGLTAEEAELDLASFEQAEEVFVTNAVFGVWPVKRLRDTVFQVGNFTKALQAMLGYANRA